VRLVRGKKDADLRQIADAVFRIRRARRNCEAGWRTLACRDYRAVVRTAPAPADRPPAEILACPPAPSHALR
ncbi:MAG TPA: hypothetical protein VHG27_10485, partial [Xanthobacteraceae bacterium]|nr:hypothetical protein [Xanthobacteraceae bacterium]